MNRRDINHKCMVLFITLLIVRQRDRDTHSVCRRKTKIERERGGERGGGDG